MYLEIIGADEGAFSLFFIKKSSSFPGCFPAIIPQKKPSILTNEVKPSKNDTVTPESVPPPASAKSLTSEAVNSYGSLKEMPKVIWQLLTNPLYMMINLGGGADGFTIAGLSAFLPKFLQSQYGFSAGTAAALVGILVIPAGGKYIFICTLISLINVGLRLFFLRKYSRPYAVIPDHTFIFFEKNH